MNALELFRTGLDTVAIAGILRLTEAEASYRVYQLRCKERELPFRRRLPPKKMEPVWPRNRLKAAGC